jgi:hypothetical protein
MAPEAADTLLVGAARLESQSKALTIKTLESLDASCELMLPSFDNLRSLTWPMAICRRAAAYAMPRPVHPIRSLDPRELLFVLLFDPTRRPLARGNIDAILALN